MTHAPTQDRPAATSARIEVDLGALARNAATLADRAGVPLLPMVKANAYGVGVDMAVHALHPLAEEGRVWGFGVATPWEGADLRQVVLDLPIVVFTPSLPAHFELLRRARLTPVLGDPETIREWIETGGGPWHLGVDTGMHRAGLPWSRVGEFADLVASHPPEGACTHFHSAEREDGTFERQDERFREAIAALEDRPALLHADNSAAIVRRAGDAYDLVRPGVFLYGVGSGASIEPEPVIHLRGAIVELRDVAAGETVSYGGRWTASEPRRIATVNVGYADGYRRALGDRAEAIVHGTRVPVRGVVTMDMTMVDVTAVACAVGDEVTLVGRDGGEVITLEELARLADCSPYELLTGLGTRPDRAYVGDPFEDAVEDDQDPDSGS